MGKAGVTAGQVRVAGSEMTRELVILGKGIQRMNE